MSLKEGGARNASCLPDSGGVLNGEPRVFLRSRSTRNIATSTVAASSARFLSAQRTYR